MGSIRLALRAAVVVATFIAPSVARSDENAAEFYAGKTVRLVVGTSPGGGYDTYARLLAPHLQERLKANVVVENRPGGSHMVAMNYVYSLAAPDGLTIMLATGEGAVLAKLLDEPGIRFDLAKFPVLGRVNTAPRVLLVNPPLGVSLHR